MSKTEHLAAFIVAQIISSNTFGMLKYTRHIIHTRVAPVCIIGVTLWNTSTHNVASHSAMDQCVPESNHPADATLFKLIQENQKAAIAEGLLAGRIDPRQDTADANGRPISPIVAAAAAGNTRLINLFEQHGAEFTELVLQTLMVSTWSTQCPHLAELYGHAARHIYNLNPLPSLTRTSAYQTWRVWKDKITSETISSFSSQ